jgi:hypothetical protein
MLINKIFFIAFGTVQKIINKATKKAKTIGTFHCLKISGGLIYRYMGCEKCTMSVSYNQTFG